MTRKQTITDHDADKSGTLSLDEFQGVFNDFMRHRMVRMFQKLDRNGDGQVTDEEIARRLNRIMTWMDRNDDGSVERGEMARGHHGRKYHDRDHHDDDDDERHEHGGRHHR